MLIFSNAKLRWSLKETLVLFCSAMFFISMPPTSALSSDNDTWRCAVNIRLSNVSEHSLIEYFMTLQVKNTIGRKINGVSVVYKNFSGDVIGNTQLFCGNKGEDVEPGSYAECSRSLHSVDPEKLTRGDFGQLGANILDQLQALSTVQFCDVLGFTYQSK